MFGREGSTPVKDGGGGFRGTVLRLAESNEKAKDFLRLSGVQAQARALRNDFHPYFPVGKRQVQNRGAEHVIIRAPAAVEDGPVDPAAGEEKGLDVLDIGARAFRFAPHVVGDGETYGRQSGRKPKDGQERRAAPVEFRSHLRRYLRSRGSAAGGR